MRLVLGVVVVAAWCGLHVSAKIFGKCELANLLQTKHKMSRKDAAVWTCIAQYESTFNTEAINHANWDQSKDYGLFQLNNRYWCGDEFGQNVCRIPCSALLDDDLTDDLKCIAKIVRETKRIKGPENGLTAWVVYDKYCRHRNYDTYMEECKHIPSNLIRPKPPTVAPAPVSTTAKPPIASFPTTENVPAKPTTTENVNKLVPGEDYPIINNVRVPIIPPRPKTYIQPLYHTPHRPLVMVNPYGYFYQIRYD